MTIPSPFHLLRAALAAGLALAAGAAVPAPAPSAMAPDFTLRSMSGPNLRLLEQRGQVVLVNFWATWCGPCRQEMPHLNRLYDKYKSSGFVLLGINVDDDARKAADVASKLGVRFPVLLDTDKKVSRVYDMSAMPATVLIDRDGKVRHIHRGYRDGYENTYDMQIRDLLKE
ncbi:TlpA disulfide reductase family protein [Piscinibacter sp. XHJ-5]|uniref:TlpA disulfide reductase family protein n=1 Tax=Piscinibacter sp. XHJ-5 TaxID=3037797 RepID=UPI0024534AAB|nr:TlpA disulfide reductase family protein [Piscinibacter sp. XHJ-5]